MNEIELCQSVKDKLSTQGSELTIDHIASLYIATIEGINLMLDNEDIFIIPEIGSFWRKKGVTSALTFMKPSVELNDRINL